MMNRKILLYEKNDNCCGCGTCILVCPKNAIIIRENELGCLYPVIDYEQCIGCGKCKQVCAFQNNADRALGEIPTFAAMAENSELLSKSASGGVFAVIAKNVLEQGGVVYGCSMEYKEGKLVPQHIGVEKTEELYKLQGSKYVQSSLGKTFQSVKEELRRKRLVFFSGTPCQVDSLHRYLEKEDTSLLYTVDIICHGVPSAKLFQDYIETIEGKQKGKITAFCFRDKNWGLGYNAKYTRVDAQGNEKQKKISSDSSSYYSFFLGAETHRQCCYSCKYAGCSRTGDITIGDYWCMEKEHPEYTKEQGGELSVADGVSCILVNTLQGEKLVDLYTTGLKCKKSELAKVMKWNHQLMSPSKHTEKRKQIIEIYEKKGYKGVEKLFRKDLGIKYYVRTLRNRSKQWRRNREKNIF